MAKKKDKTPMVITPKSSTKIAEVLTATYGEQEAAHKSDYVTVAKLQEVLERLDGSYVPPVTETEDEEEEEEDE
jgi:hypothetical protein